MKKLIALLLALVMVVGMAACGAKEETAAPAATEAAPAATEAAPAATEAGKPYEGVTLTLGMIPLTGMDEMTWYLEEVLPIFEEETGAKVEYTLNDQTDLGTKYLTNFMSGTNYDVFYHGANSCLDFIEQGMLEPLDNWYTEEEIANEFFWDDARAADGHVYSVPYEGGVAYRCYSYNMDILKECGVEEIPTTWDEFKAALIKIKEGRPDVYPFMVPMGDIHGVAMFLYPFMIQGGAHYIKDDLSGMEVNTPEMKAVFEYLQDLVNEGLLSKDCLGTELATCRELFQTGKAAIIITNNTYMYAGDFEWTATCEMKGEQYGVFNANAHLQMSASCENKEAAAALIKFLNGPVAREAFMQIRDSSRFRATDPEFPCPEGMEEVYAHPEYAAYPKMYAEPGDFQNQFLASGQRIIAGEDIDTVLAELQALVDASLQA